MARTKVKETALKNWDGVDRALLAIRELEAMLAEHEAEMNRLIAAAKQNSEQLAKPLQVDVKELGRQIKEYVTAHREELDGKSKKMNHGSTGFRLSTKLVVPGKAEDMVATLKRLDMLDCISTKESVNKDALKQKPTEEILKTGAYLQPTDEFWYEVAKEELLDVAT